MKINGKAFRPASPDFEEDPLFNKSAGEVTYQNDKDALMVKLLTDNPQLKLGKGKVQDRGE